MVQCSIMNVTLFPRAGTTPTNNLKYRMEEVPMKLNDSISTYDVAEALRGETGKFEVTSPTENAISLRASPDTPLSV